MIIQLVNNSSNDTVMQIDILYFIIFHIVIVLFLFFLYHHFRLKNLRKMIPTTDLNTKLESVNKELEPLGFSYDIKSDIFYSLMNSWQRDTGYCRLYDEAAATFSMIIDCEPIRFEYSGRKWLIEFWKGQYGMAIGAELGVYVASDSKSEVSIPSIDTFYESVKDEERLVMSFTLLKNNQELFYREGLHWWLTGFKLGEFSEPKSLSMQIRISFPNLKMRDAFLTSLYSAGYTKEEVMVKKQTVLLTYDKPHTLQPFTRTKMTQTIIQRSNKFYCKIYKYFTRGYNNTLDRLAYLKIFSPSLYHRVFNIGKTKEVYKDYNSVQTNKPPE